MNQNLVQITYLVDDYDEAIAFFTQKLSFVLIENTVVSPEKRWVVVAPQGKQSCKLLLAKAANDTQKQTIGNQTGGRVFLFLHTDNLARDYEDLLKNNITIIRKPSEEAFGKVLVFADLYGNLWDLIEPKNP